MIVALIPAHNEEAGIGACLDALLAQTCPPDLVVVVLDNCTDRTREVAELRPNVETFETRLNTHKKAGALNQALEYMAPWFDHNTRVMVLDADSILAPDFLAEAVRHLDRGYSACGGNFRGQPGAGMLGMFQRNEYARYARDVARLKGRCLVLTGTATVFTWPALRAVRQARQADTLPGSSTGFYDTDVLTEDNEMTFALRTLGYTVIAPKGCYLTTEVMPTWRALARQRLRWKRGAFENLRQYGFNRLTAPYWGRQLVSLVGIIITAVYLASLAAAPVLGIHIAPLWMGVSLIFMAERAVTVRERGWKMMLLGFILLPEMLYDIFLQGVQAFAYMTAAMNRKEGW